MEAIKPCPFCGEPDALYCLPILAEYMVHCNTCSATGPRTVRHDDAILLWNAAANALEAAKHECDNLREACLGYSQIQASLVEQRDEVIKERDELQSRVSELYTKCNSFESLWLAAVSQRDEARDVLDAYTTVIAARDEDERLYQDEITRLERQVATLEQQLQTELDMRNTHAVEEVEKYKAERDEAKKINETVYPKFLDLKEDVVELRDKNRCLESQLDYYKKMTNDLIAERDRLEGILQGERQSFIACGKDLLSQRDEARKWAREYKRRLIQAAKAMRGEK